MNIEDLRSNLLYFVKRYEPFLVFGLKFISGLFIYGAINNIGHYNQAFSLISGLGFLFTIFMGLLFAILPLNANYLIMVLFTTIQFTAQLEVALIVFLGLLSTFLFYGHFGKKENVLIIIVIMGFHFNMPFIAPIMAWLYFGLTSIIPISIGVFIWSYSRMIMDFIYPGVADGALAEGALAALDIEIDELMAALMSIYESFVTGGYAVQSWLIVTIAMFAPFIFVYIISKLSINYSKELSIVLGTLLSIFTFIFASLFVDLGFGPLAIIFFAPFNGAMLYLYNFFNVSLDYRHAQRVEFQDEDYYYYVKLIPKRRSAKRQESTEEEQLPGYAEMQDIPQREPRRQVEKRKTAREQRKTTARETSPRGPRGSQRRS